jgi:hypothetical protein
MQPRLARQPTIRRVMQSGPPLSSRLCEGTHDRTVPFVCIGCALAWNYRINNQAGWGPVTSKLFPAEDETRFCSTVAPGTAVYQPCSMLTRRCATRPPRKANGRNRQRTRRAAAEASKQGPMGPEGTVILRRSRGLELWPAAPPRLLLRVATAVDLDAPCWSVLEAVVLVLCC